MFRFMTPTPALRLAQQSTLMMAEAQRVIAMRMAGMAGTWNVTPGEDAQMMSEKTEAAVASGQAMMKTILAGGSAGAVVLAGLRPVRARTRANAKRLTKRGPKLSEVS